MIGLAHKLFDSDCVGYELGIRGYLFNEFGEYLSPAAEQNLEAALEFTKTYLHDEYNLDFNDVKPGKLYKT